MINILESWWINFTNMYLWGSINPKGRDMQVCRGGQWSATQAVWCNKTSCIIPIKQHVVAGEGEFSMAVTSDLVVQNYRLLRERLTTFQSKMSEPLLLQEIAIFKIPLKCPKNISKVYQNLWMIFQVTSKFFRNCPNTSPYVCIKVFSEFFE